MKELGYALSQVVHNTFGKGIVGPENWNSNAGLKLIGRCTSAKRLDGVCKKINMIMDERPSYVASKNMGEAARLQNITWTGFIIKADKEWWHQIMTTYKQSKKGLVPSSYLQASDLCLWANNVDECPFVPSESDPLIDPNTNLTRFPHFTSYHYSHLQKNPYQSSSWLQKHVLPICVLKFQASLDKCRCHSLLLPVPQLSLGLTLCSGMSVLHGWTLKHLLLPRWTDQATASDYSCDRHRFIQRVVPSLVSDIIRGTTPYIHSNSNGARYRVGGHSLLPNSKTLGKEGQKDDGLHERRRPGTTGAVQEAASFEAQTCRADEVTATVVYLRVAKPSDFMNDLSEA